MTAEVVRVRRGDRLPPEFQPKPLFNEEEQAEIARLNGFMATLNGWGLSANRTEMVAAIHVLQGFVVQHALERQFDGFSDWFRGEKPT